MEISGTEKKLPQSEQRPHRSSFSAFTQERALPDSQATAQWHGLPGTQRDKYSQEYWSGQEKQLDREGRIHRRKCAPADSHAAQPIGGARKCWIAFAIAIVVLAGIAAAVMIRSRGEGEAKLSDWDWKVTLLNGSTSEDFGKGKEDGDLAAGGQVSGRSVLILERQEPFESEMELGKGIDLANNVYGDIVNYESQVEGMSKAEMQTFLEIISEEKQKSTVAKEMAKAEIPLKGLQGGVQYLSELESNTTSLYIVIATAVVAKKIKIKAPELKPYIKDYLKAANVSSFTKKFGTHYISGYTNAAQFIGVIEIRTESKTDKDEIKASFNSTTYPNILLSLEARLSARNIAFRKNLRMYIKGVNIQRLPLSIQDLLAAHEEFILETRKTGCMPLLVTCSPLSSLPAVQGQLGFMQGLEDFKVPFFSIAKFV